MKYSGLFTRLVCTAMVLCLLSFVLVPIQAKADKISCVEYNGSNQLSESHQRWGSPVRSHLVEVENGLMRFQEISENDGYLVEYYGDALLGDPMDKLSGYTLDDYEYHIDNGEIVVTFVTYEFAVGAAGPMKIHTGLTVGG